MKKEEQFARELKQSDADHHKPTAGAMTGHVIANLAIHEFKINQARLFAAGPTTVFLDHYALNWISYEQQIFNALSQMLVNNEESIPTTTAQFAQFTMLEENGADKYLPGDDQLFNLVKDFDSQTLFITKAIQLATKEQWPELVDLLTELLAWIKQQISLTQRFLNHDLREGLYNEEDDDDF